MELDLSKAKVTYSYNSKIKDSRVLVPSKIINQLQERDDLEEMIREIEYKRWFEVLKKNMIEDKEEEL